ncbi:hypothetical protein VNI00_019287 [Paramarasmius palmivorus]|uniref:Uncharacterized protein n=1 Tax=Paramarasmius palmivorus TaxID=297713 RepID=A0AAW0ANQ0_9AGAR
MPWAKVRKSKAQRRQENRTKSARHYARHREQISARRKATRDLIATEARSEGAQATLSRKRNERGVSGEAKWNSSANQIGKRYEALQRYTKGPPSVFLDSLCNSYIASLRSTPNLAAPNSLLSAAEATVSDLLSSCYQVENEILQEGVNSEYHQAHGLTKQVKCFLDCILNMEMLDMDPDEDLAKAYHEQRLQFQKKQVQAWLDGTQTIPE